MLKTTVSWQGLVTNEVLAANEVDSIESGDKSIKKCGKLSKTGKSSKFQKLSKLGKSKSEKTSKSWNSAKSGKKLSKSGNSTNFDATKNRPKFVTSDARIAFTEAPILRHFDPKYYIQIETDASSYAIGGVLS